MITSPDFGRGFFVISIRASGAWSAEIFHSCLDGISHHAQMTRNTVARPIHRS